MDSRNYSDSTTKLVTSPHGTCSETNGVVCSGTQEMPVVKSKENAIQRTQKVRGLHEVN